MTVRLLLMLLSAGLLAGLFAGLLGSFLALAATRAIGGLEEPSNVMESEESSLLEEEAEEGSD